MKTILVLTDFSKNARIAAEAAVSLATGIGANVVLFNAYLRSQYVPALSNTGWPAECYSAFKSDSTKALKEEVKHLEKVLANQNHTGSAISITSISNEGTLTENMPFLLKLYDTALIVVGGRTKKTGDFIFGNDIQDVVSKATCPVLIFPEMKTKLEFKNIAFATDLSKQDTKPLKWLLKFAEGFNAKINVCHVSKPAKDIPDFAGEDLIYSFVNEIASVNEEKISFTDITGTHIVQELEKFRLDTNQDLLVLVYKKHSVFWRMFHESPARNFIQQQNNPVMILPEDRVSNDLEAPVKMKEIVDKRKKQSLYLL